MRGFFPKTVRLDVEQEVQHVTVLHDVILTFLAQAARRGSASLALVLNEIVVAHRFGADKAALEVGVDHARRLRRSETTLDRPGAHFLHASGEVGLQIEQLVARADHAVEARLVKTQVLEKFVAVGVVELRALLQ